MDGIIEIIKNNGWLTICIPIFALVYNFALLLYSNRAERLRFTPKQLFKRLIALNLSMSIIGSVFYGFLIGVPAKASYNQIYALILFSFLIYIFVSPVFNAIVGLFTGTYHYIIDSDGQKMYVQRKTFDDKVLLSSTTDMYFGDDEGFIRFEPSDYLDGKTIHFITKGKYAKNARDARNASE